MHKLDLKKRVYRNVSQLNNGVDKHLAQKPIYMIQNSNKQAMAWVNNMGGDNPNLHPVFVKNGSIRIRHGDRD